MTKKEIDTFMSKLGLIEGSLRNSQEYQRMNVKLIKDLINVCRDLHADYVMHHAPNVREVLMKEGLAFPETIEEIEIFDEHNDVDSDSSPIEAKEMLRRIKFSKNHD